MNRKLLTEEMKKRAWEIEQEWPNLRRTFKTEMLNKEFGTEFGDRAIQQAAKNYGLAIEHEIKADEVLAKRELNVMINQKKTALMRSVLHKETRKLSLVDSAIELANEKLSHIPEVNIRRSNRKQTRTNGAKYVEIVLADFQFKGGKEEIEYVNEVFLKVQSEIASIVKQLGNDIEIRLVFLGDDIEGSAAHDSQLLEINASAIQQTIQFSEIVITNINIIKEQEELNNLSVVFVPYSNHGMMGGKGKARYQFTEEDLGLVIYDNLKHRLDEDIYLYEIDHERMLIETEDTIYLHGHQTYLRNTKRMLETLGVDKHIYMGHLHHYEEVQEGKRIIVKFGTLRMEQQSYENMAGYTPKREFAVVTTYDNARTTKRVFV